MDTTKILIAGLVGGVVAFLLGYLSYGLLLADFFETNAGPATGVPREMDKMLWVPMILGHLSFGLLFAVIFGRWANISTPKTGAMAGAVIAFLIGFTVNMIQYGSTNLMTLNSVIADIVVMTITGAIVGAAVGWMLGRGSK